jgi:hypothetical protein
MAGFFIGEPIPTPPRKCLDCGNRFVPVFNHAAWRNSEPWERICPTCLPGHSERQYQLWLTDKQAWKRKYGKH